MSINTIVLYKSGNRIACPQLDTYSVADQNLVPKDFLFFFKISDISIRNCRQEAISPLLFMYLLLLGVNQYCCDIKMFAKYLETFLKSLFIWLSFPTGKRNSTGKLVS